MGGRRRIGWGPVALVLIATAVTAVAFPPVASAARRPDLVAASVSNPPASLAQGRSFTVRVRIVNRGTARAGRSTVRFYLSANAARDRYDLRLANGRAVTALGPGEQATATTKITLPRAIPLGKARLLACADDLKRVPESRENNNCRAARTGLVIVAPRTSGDLIDAALEDGEIDAETALVYKVLAAFGDDRLPSRFRGDDRGVMDSSALVDAAHAFESLSPGAKAALIPFLRAPAYPATWEESGSASTTGSTSRRNLRLPDAVGMPPPKVPSPLGEDGWWFYDHDRARIWFRTDDPHHEEVAGWIFDSLEEIHTDLTGLMGRSPLSDEGPHPFTNDKGESDEWGNGGGGMLDIYVVGIKGARGLTVTYPPGCTARPSFVLIDPGAAYGAVAARDIVAHEFMHVLQHTYRYAEACKNYQNLDEAVAHWAIDYVYPTDNFEHEVTYFLWYPHYALADQDYEGWVFPLYLEHVLGASTIPAIYTRAESVGPWEAIDTAVDGGLAERWPEFAYHNWNQPPVEPSFRAWDDLSDVPLAGYNTPLGARRIALGGKRSAEFGVPATITALARRYDRFSIGSDVAWLEFRNGLVGQAGASVQGLVRLRDGTWRREDWTEEDSVTFCRSRPDEDIVELVVISANSTVADLSNVVSSSSTKVVARDRCPLLATGRITARYTLDLSYGSPGDFFTGIENKALDVDLQLRFVGSSESGSLVWEDAGSTYSADFQAHREDHEHYDDGTCTETTDLAGHGSGVFPAGYLTPQFRFDPDHYLYHRPALGASYAAQETRNHSVSGPADVCQPSSSSDTYQRVYDRDASCPIGGTPSQDIFINFLGTATDLDDGAYTINWACSDTKSIPSPATGNETIEVSGQMTVTGVP